MLEAKEHRLGLIDRHYYGVWRRRAFGTGNGLSSRRKYNPNDRSWAPKRLTVVHFGHGSHNGNA